MRASATLFMTEGEFGDELKLEHRGKDDYAVEADAILLAALRHEGEMVDITVLLCSNGGSEEFDTATVFNIWMRLGEMLTEAKGLTAEARSLCSATLRVAEQTLLEDEADDAGDEI